MPRCNRGGSLFLFLALLLPPNAKAQLDAYLDSAFVHTEANRIEHARHLAPFFETLAALERGETQKLSIVHIGDSHVQEGRWDDTFRKALQQTFGNAGRGLVFPYRAVGTNGPSDLDAYSPEAWQHKRVLYPRRAPTTGVTGYGMTTDARDATLLVGLHPRWGDPEMDYAFDRVTLFHTADAPPTGLRLATGGDVFGRHRLRTDTLWHIVQPGDTLTSIAAAHDIAPADLRRWNGRPLVRVQPGDSLRVLRLRNTRARPDAAPAFTDLAPLASNGSPYAHTARWDTPVETIYLRGRPNGATLHGLSLEASQRRGVLVHGVGVNGAHFRHYAADSLFWPQLALLRPDLVIVTLGTNEALDGGIDTTAFRGHVQNFVAKLRTAAPGVPMLFTLPPDGRYRPHVPQTIGVVTGVLRAVAEAEGLAVWDHRAVMGGEGGFDVWTEYGLAKPDRVHLSMPGYRLSGLLLYRALVRAYDARRAF